MISHNIALFFTKIHSLKAKSDAVTKNILTTAVLHEQKIFHKNLHQLPLQFRRTRKSRSLRV